ncbi:MAG: Rossmann-fold NAD(P)-binding domain-containing protein [Steroidobacteraceae bacterium]
MLTTGASAGGGRAIARAFAKGDASIPLLSRDTEALQISAAQLAAAGERSSAHPDVIRRRAAGSSREPECGVEQALMGQCLWNVADQGLAWNVVFLAEQAYVVGQLDHSLQYRSGIVVPPALRSQP